MLHRYQCSLWGVRGAEKRSRASQFNATGFAHWFRSPRIAARSSERRSLNLNFLVAEQSSQTRDNSRVYYHLRLFIAICVMGENAGGWENLLKGFHWGGGLCADRS